MMRADELAQSPLVTPHILPPCRQRRRAQRGCDDGNHALSASKQRAVFAAAARGRGATLHLVPVGTVFAANNDFCSQRQALALHDAPNQRPLRIGIISLSTDRTGSGGAL